MEESVFVLREKVREAATALIAFHKSQDKADELLFGEPLKVQLQLSVWKIEGKKSKTQQIKLPHRPHAGSFDVCLFAKDEPNMESDQCQMVYKEKLRNLGITSVSEVIPLKMLKKEYIPFEARRRLSKSYNLFLADNRIFRLLHSSLGKEFYKRNRYPVTVNLEKKDLKTELDDAINSTYIILTHRGSCSNVTVANIGMTADQIADNIMATVTSLTRIVPGGRRNIKSIFVRTEKSISLPLYTSLVHEEWEQGAEEQEATGAREKVVDNADLNKLKRQMRAEAEKEAEALQDSDDEDYSRTDTKKKTPKRSAAGSAIIFPEKSAKKSKQGLKKPTPKIGGKKKK